MRKSVIALTLIFVLSVAATAFAAPGFSDVPAKHWAYDAVNQLSKAGIVDGYGDSTFRGDKMISRYEMAVITAKAVEKYSKADAHIKAIIDKLSVEFASELNTLGARVAKLEKDQPKVKVSSETRYQLNVSDPTSGKTTSDNFLRQRIYFSGPVNEKITGNLRLQWVDKALEDIGNDKGFTVDRIYFDVKDTLGMDWVMGRQTFLMGRGLLNNTSSENLDGIKFLTKVGPDLKLSGYYGREKYFDGSTPTEAREIATADLSWKASNKLTVGATYLKDADHPADVWTVNGLAKLNKVWTLAGEYGQNTKVDNNPASYFVQLSNGNLNTVFSGTGGRFVKNEQGSQAWALLYKTVDKDFWYSGSKFKGGTLLTNDQKAFEVVYQNALLKNTLLTVSFADIKVKSTGADSEKKSFARVEFFF
ncbi:S-layer homology domain-containing protein [Sporomusa sp.]|uniref:S-layer homology domain-containing protein n=1 Tax=Sporomusa sp. TaxID=2078658 RepID=UPI002C5FCE35|nr:S-layer homology domain-containing protein [Sporomusa sp.]HWR42796.1 S-layer homology domain-containing protein [Sporomusa sp.]